MKRLYVSTVGRGKSLEESSKVYCIEYPSGQILGQVRLPLSMLDLANPRGGCRGARGLTFLDGKLYAAGFDGIFEINPDNMFITRGWWTPQGNGIHQMYTTGDHITYVSTRSNSIWGFFPKSGKFFSKQDLTDIHPGTPRLVDSDCNDTLHFNSLMSPTLEYALFSEVGGVAHWPTKVMVLESSQYFGSHDLVAIGKDYVAMNHSRKRRTVLFDKKTWTEYKEVLNLPEQPFVQGSISIPGFTRGLSYLEHLDMMFIGVAPASVYIIENVLTDNITLSYIKISDEICESVFDVIPHPKDWK